MRRGLFLVGKDVDAYLASYINAHPEFDIEIDLVVLKHRDLLEFSSKFPNIKKIFSVPEFLRDNAEAFGKKADSEVLSELGPLKERYGLRGANRYIHYDFFRNRSDHDSLRKNTQDILLYIKFFESIDIESYDFVYGELSRSYYLIAFDMARATGGQYLSPANLGIIKGIAFVDDCFNIRKFEERRKRFYASDDVQAHYLARARCVIEAFRERPHYKHTFLKNDSLQLKKTLANIWRKRKNLALEAKTRDIDSKFRVDYVHSSPVSRIFKRSFMSKLKGKVYGRHYFGPSYDFRCDYIYFPLHVHPETTTSLWSEFLVDHTSQQAASVEFISKVVPAGYKIAVKEHPAMIGNREAKHYQQYDKWYNVDLVGPCVSQFELIKNCKLVLTLCGTVGIEALILGKPVVTLTNTYYSYFRQVVRAKGISDLEAAIPSAISEFQQDDAVLAEDLALLFSSVHEGVLNFLIDDNPDVVSESNLRAFAESIAYELAI